MIADVVARRTDRAGVGRPAALLGAHGLLVDALGDEEGRDLVEELVVEPGGEPPHLDARAGIGRQQPALAGFGAARLVEIFGDDRGAGHRRTAFLDQHRRGAFRIEREEFLAPLPHALLDQARRDAVLAERQAHEARMRAERMMEQGHYKVSAKRGRVG